jgi:hypothetical protein
MQGGINTLLHLLSASKTPLISEAAFGCSHYGITRGQRADSRVAGTMRCAAEAIYS